MEVGYRFWLLPDPVAGTVTADFPWPSWRHWLSRNGVPWASIRGAEQDPKQYLSS